MTYLKFDLCYVAVDAPRPEIVRDTFIGLSKHEGLTCLIR